MLYYTSCELKLSLTPIKLAETLASLSTHMFYVVLVCVYFSENLHNRLTDAKEIVAILFKFAGFH